MNHAVRVGMLAAQLACAGSVVAQTPPDYGYSWSTIGMPGNRAANQTELLGSGEQGVGVVNYEYRMSRTEVTVGQWLEFVQAYSAFYEGPAFNPQFSGSYIYSANSNPSSPGDWRIVDESFANIPTTMGWRYAARYCNWLTNGKSMTRAAFENGAYDTSTFRTNPDGTFTDQTTHSSTALFWIPTREEWDKAMYFDPNRYGAGQEGYWFYPTGNDLQHPPVSGYPGEGGETNVQIVDDDGRVINVGSYTNTTSPWGLWDGSGGFSEWTGTAVGYAGELPVDRYVRGSSRGDAGLFLDWINVPTSRNPTDYAGVGLRISSVVPVPSTFVPVGVAAGWIVSRKRKRK